MRILKKKRNVTSTQMYLLTFLEIFFIEVFEILKLSLCF